MENQSLENKIKYQKKIIYILSVFVLCVVLIFNNQINQLSQDIETLEKNIESNFENNLAMNRGIKDNLGTRIDTQLLCIQELTAFLYNLNNKITLREPTKTIFGDGQYRIYVDSFFPSQGYFFSECFENLQNQ